MKKNSPIHFLILFCLFVILVLFPVSSPVGSTPKTKVLQKCGTFIYEVDVYN